MRPRCADVRVWGGQPPEEFYIPDEKLTKKQKVKLEAWRKELSRKWDIRKLTSYLIENDLVSQDLSDEELNQFRRNL